MTRKNAWLCLAVFAAGGYLAACSSGDEVINTGGNTTGSGASGTGANSGTGGDVGTGGTGASGSGASPGTGGTGGATGGTGGIVEDTRPPHTEGFDCTPAEGAVPPLKLTEFVSGFTRPVFMAPIPGAAGRFVVLEQDGLIKLVKAENGQATVQSTPFLDLTSRTARPAQDDGDYPYDERGVLGIAFHPSFTQNATFYVYHTSSSSIPNAGDRDSVLVEYKVSSANPDVADAGSARILATLPQPANNHKGGTIAFGADGYLYWGLGDGGGSNNQYGNARNLASPLAKMLRIDVDQRDAGQYGIPPGNLKEVQPTAVPEAWAWGLRNPYRWSFDGCTGDLYLPDVGQGTLEEVNVEPRGVGHRDYGWDVMEGTGCFNPSTGCAETGLTLPVATFSNNGGSAVTGGYVYRGSAIPGLRGHYFYADYGSDRVWTFRWDGAAPQELTSRTGDLSWQVGTSAFAQDLAGEVYVVNIGGTVWRIDAE